jgi:hypothetical protein
MNELNYASLEASKKMVDNGIVLETDAVWVKWYFDSSTPYNREPYEWRLQYKALIQTDFESISAPCFTEVWMELEKNTIFYGADLYFSFNLSEFGFYTNSAKFSDGLGRINSPTFMSDNHTDALIDLLVWLKGAGK